MKLVFGKHFSPHYFSDTPLTTNNLWYFLERSQTFMAILPDFFQQEDLQSFFGNDIKKFQSNALNCWASSPEILREIEARIRYSETTYNQEHWKMVNLSAFMHTKLFQNLTSCKSPSYRKNKFTKTDLENRDSALYETLSTLDNLSSTTQTMEITNIHEPIQPSDTRKSVSILNFKSDINTFEKNQNHKVINYFSNRPHLFRSVQLFHVNKKLASKSEDVAYIQHICSVHDFNNYSNLNKADGYFVVFIHDFKFLLSLLVNPWLGIEKDFSFPEKYRQKYYFETIQKTGNWLLSKDFFKKIGADSQTEYLINYQWDRMLMLRWQLYFFAQPDAANKIDEKEWCVFYQIYDKFVNFMAIDRLFIKYLSSINCLSNSVPADSNKNSHATTQSYFSKSEEKLIILTECPSQPYTYFQKLGSCFSSIISLPNYDYSL